MKPKMSFRDWCIQNHAYLLLHFYQEGNNPCAPEEIGFSAGKRVRFRCHVCGLSWQRTLKPQGIRWSKPVPSANTENPARFTIWRRSTRN